MLGNCQRLHIFLDSNTLPHDILDSHFDICKYLDVKTIPIKCMNFFFFFGTPPSAHQVKYTAKNAMSTAILNYNRLADEVENFCEEFLVTSEWREDVNTPSFKSP